MKQLDFKVLSFGFVRIMSFLFALCVTPYQASAQEFPNSEEKGSLADMVFHNDDILLSEGMEGISNIADGNMPIKKSLSTYDFPMAQARKVASRASTATNVYGLIDASTLPDNATIVLTGNTNLYMNVNKALQSISGDYTLTISGGNILTLNNPEGYAIDVASATISAPLVVSSSYIAIGAQTDLTINNSVKATSTNTCIGVVDGTIIINADVTAHTTSSAAILNRTGDVIINKGIVNVAGGNSGDWAYGIAALGNIISKTGTTINATGGTAIYSEKGSIHLSGDVTATAKGKKGYGLYAKNGEISVETVTIPSSYIAIGALTGLTINNTVNATSTNTCIGTVEGTLTINADVTAGTTSSAGILNRTGDIIINKGIVNVAGGNSGDWAYGIAALGNIISKTGTTINATGGTAIYSEKGSIHLSGDVTATAKGKKGYGLYAKNGEISVETVTIPSSYIAIGALTGLTINNTVNATSTNTCIGTVEGTLTINADVTAGTTSSAGILNRTGDVIINKGIVNVVGGNSGDWAYGIAALGNISIKSGQVAAKGGHMGLFAQNGSITIAHPLIIASPWEGRISADGHKIIDQRKDVATRVVIKNPPISGVVALSTAPSPGNELGFTLSGDITSAETENIWQISDDNITWQDVEENVPAGAPAHDGVNRVRNVANELVYVPTEDQIGKYIRVKVASNQYSGYIYSPSRQITKKLCMDEPVVPTLTNINDKVHVSNAKTTQEYIIFNYSKEASSLTESDWNNAVTPDSEVGFFEMSSSKNANHTVFTRIKETTSTLAGEQVVEGRLYIGTSVYLEDIELSISKTVGYFQNICNELNCKVGDVIRCEASPVPSNATNWYGISGSNWTVDNRNTGSPYGIFYEDENCTTPISSTGNYKTVYLKTLTEKNYLEVRIMMYNSSIGYKTHSKQFNITTDGYFPSLDYIANCSMTIAAGERLTNLEVGRRPLSGSVYGLTTQVSGEGTAPIVSFTMYERMNVNATNATPGIYTFTPIQNGKPLSTSAFTITVTDGKYGVDSLLMREKYIVADPSERIELVAQLMPANSEAEIQWESSNTSVAIVANGVVTIADNVAIGAVATITASANGKSDECKITVSGEEYGLYVASVQVTSRNRDDILGDGKFSFDGLRTLTMNGDYTVSNSSNFVRNTDIDDLNIEVAQACTISQDSESYSTLFDIRKNTIIRGEQLTVNGNGVAFSTQGGTTLTLDSANLVVSAIMPFKGSSISSDSLSIINSRVEVHTSGSAAVFSFEGGISLTDCYIQTPAGGEVVDAAIEDGNGNYARDVVIAPLLMLYEDVDNTAVLETHVASGKTTNVQLVNRTFYKDNSWSTLCLPFDVTNLNGTPLEGATIMEPNTAKRNGFDCNTGMLYLSFKTVTEIEAGKPYIVKWDNGENIENPLFEDVVITSYEPIAVESDSYGLNTIYMVGSYAHTYVTGGDQSVMFMDAEKVICYPTEDAALNSFYAYFEIPSLQGAEETAVKAYTVDFDGGVVGIKDVDIDNEQYPKGWYTITGVKLSQMPVERGVYINNGRKVIIR